MIAPIASCEVNSAGLGPAIKLTPVLWSWSEDKLARRPATVTAGRPSIILRRCIATSPPVSGRSVCSTR